MQKIGATGDGKSAVATPDGKKPKEEEEEEVEAVKRLDRFAPNFAHMCRFIWDGYRSNKLPFETQGGALGFFRG